ncbi:MAG: hypothetical protein ACYC5Y_06940 [Symbiobacteriia bacterium]
MKEKLRLASLWLPVVLVMGLIFYGSSRPEGAKYIIKPIRAAIVQVLGGGAHHGA